MSVEDPVLERITELFDGKVGGDYEEKRKAEIIKEGERRYSRKIPPGWKDETKGDARQFGDLIIWRQMIDRAREVKIPIIFVSDDRKEDWWWSLEGKTIGPLPDLIQEMDSEAGQPFWMYPPDVFMRRLAEQKEIETPTLAIQEVKNVRESKEQAQRVRFRLTSPAFEAFLRSVQKPTALEEAVRRIEAQRRALERALTPSNLSAIERAILGMAESLPDDVTLDALTAGQSEETIPETSPDDPDPTTTGRNEGGAV
jgi:hypothetical protein